MYMAVVLRWFKELNFLPSEFILEPAQSLFTARPAEEVWKEALLMWESEVCPLLSEKPKSGFLL